MSATINGYTLTSAWSGASGGHIAFAEKSGKKYFLKRYNSITCPNRSDCTPKTFANRKTTFEKFMITRKHINRVLREVSGEGGNIVAAFDVFFDPTSSRLVEVTEFIPNLMSVREILKQPYEEKKLLLTTAARALATIHNKCEIIHGDLKADNLVAAKNIKGLMVGKVIDFDCSFFQNNVPRGDIGGDQNYMAPELIMYISSEMDERLRCYITQKIDIFSLGLVFHYYLCGKLPEYRNIQCPKTRKRYEMGERVYPATALLKKGEFVLNKAIEEKGFLEIITRMLKLNPEERPTASEVCAALKKIGKAESVGAPSRKEEIKSHFNPKEFCKPDKAHKICFQLGNLKKAGYTSARLERTIFGKRYILVDAKGKQKKFNVDKLIMNGYALPAYMSSDEIKSHSDKDSVPSHKKSPAGKKIPGSAIKSDGKVATGFENPWPEDRLCLIEDNLLSAGYVRLTRIKTDKKRIYCLMHTDGYSKHCTAEKLIMFDYAKRLSEDSSKAEVKALGVGLWHDHEDEYQINNEALKNAGYKHIQKVQKGEVKSYTLIRNDGSKKNVSLQNLFMFGYIMKKEVK